MDAVLYSCPFRECCRTRPSHNLIVLSQLPAATAVPLGAMAIHSTSPVCFHLPRSRQVAVSHSLMSPGCFQSPPPLTSVLPSSLNATDHTSPACPLRAARCFRLGTSQTTITS